MDSRTVQSGHLDMNTTLPSHRDYTDLATGRMHKIMTCVSSISQAKTLRLVKATNKCPFRRRVMAEVVSASTSPIQKITSHVITAK